MCDIRQVEYAPGLREQLSEYSFGRLLLSRVDGDQQCLRNIVGACWETDAADSCNLTVDRQIFERLGGFGNLPGAGYWEDCVFAWRARRQGIKLIINRELVVYSHDPRLSLRQICEREELVAADYASLSSTMPEEFGEISYFADSRARQPSDAFSIKCKKYAKHVMAQRLPLELLISGAEFGERMRLPDPVLHPYFEHVMYLHTIRGLRAATIAPVA